MKKLIEIPVVWEMYGSYYIEVDENATKEEIERLAEEYAFNEETPLPDERHYVDGSLTTDKESCWYLEEVK